MKPLKEQIKNIAYQTVRGIIFDNVDGLVRTTIILGNSDKCNRDIRLLVVEPIKGDLVLKLNNFKGFKVPEKLQRFMILG